MAQDPRLEGTSLSLVKALHYETGSSVQEDALFVDSMLYDNRYLYRCVAKGYEADRSMPNSSEGVSRICNPLHVS